MLSEHAIRVRNALIEHGLETPMQAKFSHNKDAQLARLTGLFSEVVDCLGLDLNNDSLSDTPTRIARMYLNEIFAGLDYAHFPKISLIQNEMRVDEPISVHDIALTSTCEHHFITIDGRAHVSYIPKDTIIGLSKINRLVQFFARRPQVQERLNRQILIALQTLLGTENVAVKIEATHYCVKARGIMDTSSFTRTQALGGVFKSAAQPPSF